MKLEQAVLYYTITLETSLTSQLPSTTEGVDLASETSLKQKSHMATPFSRLLTLRLVSVILILWICASSCKPSFL